MHLNLFQLTGVPYLLMVPDRMLAFLYLCFPHCQKMRLHFWSQLLNQGNVELFYLLDMHLSIHLSLDFTTQGCGLCRCYQFFHGWWIFLLINSRQPLPVFYRYLEPFHQGVTAPMTCYSLSALWGNSRGLFGMLLPFMWSENGMKHLDERTWICYWAYTINGPFKPSLVLAMLHLLFPVLTEWYIQRVIVEISLQSHRCVKCPFWYVMWAITFAQPSYSSE